MQTMRRIGVQINGKLVGSCDSISKVSSPLFKDILDPWFDIEGFVPAKPPLNENQLIVLEWLKDGDNSPFAMISTLDDDFVGIDTGCLIPTKVREGFETLSNIEQFQVLQAFAEWGMKNE